MKPRSFSSRTSTGKGKPKAAPAIGLRQKQLAEQESLVKKRIIDLERQIEEAPQRRQEQLKIQRDELLQRHQKSRPRDFVSSLSDKRHTLNTTTVARPRQPRKGERRAIKIKFCALLAVLVVAAWLVIRAVPWTTFNLLPWHF